jgi:hypothetical protein
MGDDSLMKRSDESIGVGSDDLEENGFDIEI